MSLRDIACAVTAVFVLIGVEARSAVAQPTQISLIRDAEIESPIRRYAQPVFSAAGLNQGALNIHLVADQSLNAFVLGGQRIFVNTGLIQRTEHPGQLIGVIAHETGHLAAGHLSKLSNELRGATATTILSTILGVAAAVVTEDPTVGGAAVAFGRNAVTRNVLSFTRGMEAAADQAALRYLDEAQLSSRGMMEFLAILGGQAGRVVGIDPYLLTHPEPEARVAAVQSHLLLSRFSDRPISPDLNLMHERMRAKLDAFLNPPNLTLQQYTAGNRSVGARYARAIASFRRGDLAASLQLIDSLLVEFPNDPYFHEVRGDALFNNGRIIESVKSYETAVALAEDQPLLRISLAQAQLETGSQAQISNARDNLRAAIIREADSLRAWHFLTIAYGRLGDRGNLALAQAETGYLRGDQTLAREKADEALELLPQGSAGWLRAQDLVERIRS